jgi:riboflavin synthase
MFTGIVETTATVVAIEKSGSNTRFTLQTAIANELKVDQSVSHNGVCLTVESIQDNTYTVTAIEETLKKTNLGLWKKEQVVNVERCMPLNGRLDGHIVQGHVDTTAVCTQVITLQGSWEYTFAFAPAFAHLVIEKGSISVNGTSLTCFAVGKENFTVAIIPYTYEHTSIKYVEAGDTVNIEFDIIGKYIARMQSVKA